MDLYYVIINGGDGSAYLNWFESDKLAVWVEEKENDNEGFFDASGHISLESSSPIKADCTIETKESWLVELLGNEDDKAIEFVDKFFDHCPQITARSYGPCHNIYFDGELAGKKWASKHTQQDADDLASFYNESLRRT